MKQTNPFAQLNFDEVNRYSVAWRLEQGPRFVNNAINILVAPSRSFPQADLPALLSFFKFNAVLGCTKLNELVQ